MEGPIHTLALPDGIKLDRSSYEAFLRYVLPDIAAAWSATACQTRRMFPLSIFWMSSSL